MNREERVLTALALANPIPSVDDLDLIQVDSTRYLATLERRSNEMTQLSTRQESATSGRRRRPLLVAVTAVAAIAVAATAAVLVMGNREPDVVAPEPEDVVNEFLAATDYDAIAATMTPEAIADLNSVTLRGLESPEQVNDELTAKAILGVEITVQACQDAGPGTLRCDVSYRSNVSPVPRSDTVTFYFSEDGLISVAPRLPSEDPGFEIMSFAQDQDMQQEWTAASCNAQYLTSACAGFVIDNLDAWQQWQRVNG